ncbi:unnamed protein product [Mucor hiemalis]
MVNSTPTSPAATSEVIASQSPVNSVDSPSVPEPATPEPIQEGVATTIDSMEEVEETDPATSKAPEILHRSSNLSKHAVPRDIMNASPEELYKIAEENLVKMKAAFGKMYVHYITLQEHRPYDQETLDHFEKCKIAEKGILDAEATLKMYKRMNTAPAPAPAPQVKKTVSKVFPANLPFLQLKSDTVIEKKNVEIFDSVFDFCSQFQTVLEAHTCLLEQRRTILVQ